MSSSAGCILLPRSEPRAWCRIETKRHEPYDWALPGTLENIARVDEFLKEREINGYLFGGCLDKRLPRKDIDVFLELNLDNSSDGGYKTLGVDWWFKDYSEWGAVGENVNGIVARLPTSKENYLKKEAGGLLLPEYYLEEHPRSQPTKILYTSSELKNLRGEK